MNNHLLLIYNRRKHYIYHFCQQPSLLLEASSLPSSSLLGGKPSRFCTQWYRLLRRASRLPLTPHPVPPVCRWSDLHLLWSYGILFCSILYYICSFNNLLIFICCLYLFFFYLLLRTDRLIATGINVTYSISLCKKTTNLI